MASVSGLSRPHRLEARARAANAAWLTYHHRGRVHYTQGTRRWSGINQELNARRGQYPRHADCSSFAAWCLWNGLYVPFQVRDTVNGLRWKYGFTGTMLEHGKEVRHLDNVLRGDCVIYGSGAGKHTALIVGVHHATPMVISHGSEGGPFYLPYDYRSDVNCIRRYI